VNLLLRTSVKGGVTREVTMRSTLILAPAAIAVLAACGGTSTTASSPSSSAATTAASPHSPGTTAPAGVLAVRTTSLGPILVDSRGHTVYLLTADKPEHSTCSATCLTYWPAVAAPSTVPSTVPGVTAKVASTNSMAGGKILTVGGWPVYTFVKDKGPGDVTGQEVKAFGGTWYAVSPSGHKVEMETKPSPTTTHSGGGGYSGSGY
jgi:predicted lipoprotein with Yx(FWY)xxD motif